MCRIAIAALLLATAAASASPARAQYTGFAAGGRGGTGDDRFDPRFALAAGYGVEVGGGPGGGLGLGLRLSTGYAAFRGNAAGYTSGAGVAATALDGGGATMWDEGLDFVLSDRSGPVVLHGFYGLRYFQQSRDEARVQFGAGTDTLRFRYRTDFGRAYGFGATLRGRSGQGVFGEWFRVQPYDRRMIRQAGLRFGVSWTSTTSPWPERTRTSSR